MRAIPDDLTVSAEAHKGPVQPHTATLHELPISCHHTVRSVAYQAYRSLWRDEPDRAERWHRISNMDQVFGTGRPLRTISHAVVQAAMKEMHEMEMPEEDIRLHFDNFAALMLWADAWGFIRWGRRPDET